MLVPSLISFLENTVEEGGLLMDERVAEHVLEEALWSVIRKRQQLNERYRDHIRDCRDCREFVKEVACEAEGQGFTLDESFQMTLNAL